MELGVGLDPVEVLPNLSKKELEWAFGEILQELRRIADSLETIANPIWVAQRDDA